MIELIPVGAKGWPIGEACSRTLHTDAEVSELLRRAASGESLRDAAAALGIPYETAKAYKQGKRRESIPSEWRPRRIKRERKQ